MLTDGSPNFKRRRHIRKAVRSLLLERRRAPGRELAHPKLRAGYLLDGLEHLDRKPAAPERLAGFLESVGAATQARQRSAGLGEDVRLHGERVVGSGLDLEGELLQLCAFTGDERSGRIARPSRRA